MSESTGKKKTNRLNMKEVKKELKRLIDANQKASVYYDHVLRRAKTLGFVPPSFTVLDTIPAKLFQ